ncbi:MAG: hypothetical protein K2O45_03545 [Oscillospiraceae bacterium]|nr:hypothetical protein [Oscillospiraceae bacterium]
MQDVFFSATKKALANITATYDTVWPTAVGLWNLRCMVNGVKKECPLITDAQLTAKFSLGSGIHGVNYKRAFVEHSWEKQQSDFAWILLNSTIPIFEGWLEELKDDIFADLKVKEMQFPIRVRSEVARLTNNESSVLKDCFYTVYSNKRDRCYSQIDSLMYCYRVFKETRNCYMHNGLKADDKLMTAYNNYLPHQNTGSLYVSEVPELYAPTLDEPIKVSLRGVVGFSYILIKIMVSLDAELLRSSNAETEFLARYKKSHSDKDGHFNLRTLKTDKIKAQGQVSRYINQCSFAKPNNVETITEYLLQHQLVSR